MCPGGQAEALDLLLPLLGRVAAKDGKGRACVGRAGTGGSGHYVKMIHNGIEHGMMSALAEAWHIMSLHLGMGYDAIGDELARWNASREMVGIGAAYCPETQVSNKAPEKYLLDRHRGTDMQAEERQRGACVVVDPRQSGPGHRRERRNGHLVSDRSCEASRTCSNPNGSA